VHGANRPVWALIEERATGKNRQTFAGTTRNRPLDRCVAWPSQGGKDILRAIARQRIRCKRSKQDVH
jgi:hypothetical protein